VKQRSVKLSSISLEAALIASVWQKSRQNQQSEAIVGRISKLEMNNVATK